MMGVFNGLSDCGPANGDPKASMIITTKNGRQFDSNQDLTASERHILQKLFLWESMASSLQEFREKKKAALSKGWNDSGPVKQSEALRKIILHLEENVTLRLKRS
jgi:hypothetical protein